MLAASNIPRPVRTLALALLLLAGGAALLAPLLTYPFGRDQGVFACVADVIGRGGVPYRDAWEIKPPGIYYLFWASFALFGRSMLAPRLLDFIWSLAAAGLLVRLGRKLLSLWAGLAGALFFLVLYALGFSFWNSTQCDGFPSLPLAAAAVLLLAAEDRRSPWLAAACGALVGITISIKLTLAAFLALPFLAAFFSQGESARARSWRIAGCLLGCSAVLGLVTALIWHAGALKDMTYILFTWDSAYGALASPSPMTIKIPYQTFLFLLGGQYWILRLIGALALLGVADLARRPDAGRTRWLIPTWALLMFAGVWVQDKYHAYHWLPALPPVALLAGQGLACTPYWLRRALPRRAAHALTAGLLLLLAAVFAPGYWTQFKGAIRYTTGRISRAEFISEFVDDRGDFSLPADLQVSAFLRQHTDPGTPIYIWGFEPLVYFLADRPPASRFITLQPLVCPWSPREWRQDLLRDLEKTRPPYLLVLYDDVFPWVTASPLDSAGQLRSYPELQQLLDTDYQAIRRIEDFDIWQRK